MKTILISGKARAGKDYTASFLKEHYEKEGKRVIIMHFADLLKFYCKTYFGWNGEKVEAGRTLLQHIGTDIVRKKKPSFWVDQVNRFLDIFEDELDYVFIADCRFPNELDAIESRFGPVKARVERPGFENNLTEEQKNHPSETALDGYTDYDVVLYNTGDERYHDEILSKIKFFE